MGDLEQYPCLIVSEADDGIAPGSIHPAIMADTGTIRTCRWQRRVAAVTVTRWLPLAQTGQQRPRRGGHPATPSSMRGGTR
jgi:hypothetical protein